MCLGLVLVDSTSLKVAPTRDFLKLYFCGIVCHGLHCGFLARDITYGPSLLCVTLCHVHKTHAHQDCVLDEICHLPRNHPEEARSSFLSACISVTRWCVKQRLYYFIKKLLFQASPQYSNDSPFVCIVCFPVRTLGYVWSIE